MHMTSFFPHTRDAVKGSVKNLGRGFFALSFTPTSTGECELQVMISGRAIHGSPFKVNVEVSEKDAAEMWTLTGDGLRGESPSNTEASSVVHASLSTSAPPFCMVVIFLLDRVCAGGPLPFHSTLSTASTPATHTRTQSTAYPNGLRRVVVLSRPHPHSHSSPHLDDTLTPTQANAASTHPQDSDTTDADGPHPRSSFYSFAIHTPEVTASLLNQSSESPFQLQNRW